jgi:hypothetical protein
MHLLYVQNHRCCYHNGHWRRPTSSHTTTQFLLNRKKEATAVHRKVECTGDQGRWWGGAVGAPAI